MPVNTINHLGTALTRDATKVMMLGCGELGKEVVIELQRLGVELSPLIDMPMPQPCAWRIAVM